MKSAIIDGQLMPNLDSTVITDTRGNGVGDQITIHIRKAVSANADELSLHQNLQYSWPTQTAFLTPSTVTVNVM